MPRWRARSPPQHPPGEQVSAPTPRRSSAALAPARRLIAGGPPAARNTTSCSAPTPVANAASARRDRRRAGSVAPPTQTFPAPGILALPPARRARWPVAARGRAQPAPPATALSALRGLPAWRQMMGQRQAHNIRRSNTDMVTYSAIFSVGIPARRRASARRVSGRGAGSAAGAAASTHRSRPGSSPARWPAAPEPAPHPRGAAA